MRRRSALALATVALFALAAAPASADTFCVGSPEAGCFPSLQPALDAADMTMGADTITIATGTFAGGTADADNPVTIVGAGPTQSTLTAALPSAPVLQLDNAASTVSLLHVSVSSGIGLKTLGSAADLLVDAPPETTPVVGVELDGAATLRGSVVTLPAGTGIAAQGPAADATLRNVTAWGAGAGQGVTATLGGKAHLVSTVVRNFATDLANTSGTLTANDSAFGPTSGLVTGASNVTADPGFLDAAAGDFRLPYSSPLVDAGEPGDVSSPTSDFAGAVRFVNGRVDIGAFEYQRRSPVVSIVVSQGSPRAGDPVGFDGGGSGDLDPGDVPLTFAWSFDDGGAGSGPAIAHVFATAGQHTATLTVTDPVGVSTSASRAVDIAARGGGTLPPVASLSAFTATKTSKLKKGTKFRYTLTGTAKSVKVSFEVLLAGKTSGRSCVKPTRKLTKAKGCTRAVAKGGISGPTAEGRNSLSWDGRIKRKALDGGRYRATIQATDRFGRLSNRKTLSLSIATSR